MGHTSSSIGFMKRRCNNMRPGAGKDTRDERNGGASITTGNVHMKGLECEFRPTCIEKAGSIKGVEISARMGKPFSQRQGNDQLEWDWAVCWGGFRRRKSGITASWAQDLGGVFWPEVNRTVVGL